MEMTFIVMNDQRYYFVRALPEQVADLLHYGYSIYPVAEVDIDVLIEECDFDG